jgi:hypothetical protein
MAARHPEIEYVVADLDIDAATCEVHGSISTDRFEGGERPLELDTTPTCARIGMEAFLRNEIRGRGLLAPEVSFEPEGFIQKVIEASRLTMHIKETLVSHDLRQVPPVR